MGQIIVEGMEFYAYHGHFKEEQIVGNKFLIDLIIDTDTSKPEKTDNLEDALDYSAIYNDIKDEMQTKSFLVENIAGRIINRLYDKYSAIIKIDLKVSKLNPPLGGKTEKVSIRLTRERE